MSIGEVDENAPVTATNSNKLQKALEPLLKKAVTEVPVVVEPVADITAPTTNKKKRKNKRKSSINASSAAQAVPPIAQFSPITTSLLSENTAAESKESIENKESVLLALRSFIKVMDAHKKAGAKVVQTAAAQPTPGKKRSRETFDSSRKASLGVGSFVIAEAATSTAAPATVTDAVVTSSSTATVADVTQMEDVVALPPKTLFPVQEDEAVESVSVSVEVSAPEVEVSQNEAVTVEAEVEVEAEAEAEAVEMETVVDAVIESVEQTVEEPQNEVVVEMTEVVVEMTEAAAEEATIPLDSADAIIGSSSPNRSPYSQLMEHRPSVCSPLHRSLFQTMDVTCSPASFGMADSSFADPVCIEMFSTIDAVWDQDVSMDSALSQVEGGMLRDEMDGVSSKRARYSEEKTLPAQAVTVDAYQVLEDHVQFAIQMRINGCSQILYRRYSDFLTLHKTLTALMPLTQPLPPKQRFTFWGRWRNQPFLEKRQVGLEGWLKAALQQLDLMINRGREEDKAATEKAAEAVNTFLSLSFIHNPKDNSFTA